MATRVARDVCTLSISRSIFVIFKLRIVLHFLFFFFGASQAPTVSVTVITFIAVGNSRMLAWNVAQTRWDLAEIASGTPP